MREATRLKETAVIVQVGVHLEILILCRNKKKRKKDKSKESQKSREGKIQELHKILQYFMQKLKSGFQKKERESILYLFQKRTGKRLLGNCLKMKPNFCSKSID